MTKNYFKNVNVVDFILKSEKDDSPLISPRHSAYVRTKRALRTVLVLFIFFLASICWLTTRHLSGGIFLVCCFLFYYIFAGLANSVFGNATADSAYVHAQRRVERALPAVISDNENARKLAILLFLAGKEKETCDAFMDDQELVKLLKSFDAEETTPEINDLIDADCQKLYEKVGYKVVADAVKTVHDDCDGDVQADLLRCQNLDKMSVAKQQIC